MTNSPPWATDFSLTPQKVHEIITANIKNFSIESIESIELLGQGWDNTLWRVNQVWCFRFPKHAQSAQLLLNELKVLKLLPDLGVARPTPEFIVETPEHFPYPFYAYSFLVGKTADKCALTNQQRLKLVMPLAYFFKTLHAFPLEKALAAGINYDRFDRVGVKPRFDSVKERLAYLIENTLVVDDAMYLHCYQKNLALVPDEHFVLSHGDSYARHFLLDEELQLTGVIDWGDSELIHPANDLSLVYSFLPHQGHEDFFHIYGEVPQKTKILALLRAIYSMITISWYGHQVEDQLLLTEGLKGLSLLKETISHFNFC